MGPSRPRRGQAAETEAPVAAPRGTPVGCAATAPASRGTSGSYPACSRQFQNARSAGAGETDGHAHRMSPSSHCQVRAGTWWKPDLTGEAGGAPPLAASCGRIQRSAALAASVRPALA